MPLKAIPMERLRGKFSVDGNILRGHAFAGHLEDGTQFVLICKDFEGIGSMLDQLEWKGDVDPKEIKHVVMASAETLCSLTGPSDVDDDDIPF